MKLARNCIFLVTTTLAITSNTSAQDEFLIQDTIVVETARSNPMLADVEAEVSLDVADIRSYGAASLEELLADLAPLTQSAGGGRGGGAPAILLNGRRISGFREIRNFPPESLAKVEILPEEVALKFGFRADQKVINFTLRDRFHALSTRTGLEAATEGGQWLGEFEGSNLRIRDEGRWNLDFEYEYQDALSESDRDIEREDSSNTADRTLQPEQEQIALTGSYSHFLPGDIAATYTAGLDASRQERAVAQSDLADTLGRDQDQWGAEASFVLNQTHDGWNWTVNGGYAHSDTESETEMDPISGFAERTESTSDTANLDGTVFVSLFELPAGDLVTTLKAGLATQDLSSFSDQDGAIETSDLSRDETHAQINLDLPVFDKDMEGLPFGTVSLNANARVDDLSDAGTLSTFGAGVVWKPTSDVQVIWSTSLAEDAPTLSELGDPISVVDTARVFDFSTGETVENVTRITGGNPDLQVEERQVNRVNLSWEPFDERNITLNFGYTDTEIENAILAFPGLTPAIEAAFPERVIRDMDGTLLSLDARPLSIAEQSQEQIRYGFNWSISLPRPERPDLDQDERRQLREIFFRRLDDEDRARIEQRIAEREARQAAGGESQRQGGDRPGAGRGRGGGRFGGRRGGRGGSRLFLSLYHTWVLEDSLLIAAGDAPLDLLDGDAISDQGGTSEHRLEGQAGFSRGALGGFFRVNWQSETQLIEDNGSALRFDDLATADLRLQYNFGNNPRLLLRYPILDSTRISVGVNNLFDEKLSVTDETGAVPINYQPDLLDPRGRTLTFRLRKLFY